jgi:hypothetical protein
MAPTFFFFLLSFTQAWWSRELLTDWPSFLWQEGRLDYGALRLELGQWPYLHFYFSDTPGSLALQWLSRQLSLPSLFFHLTAAALAATTVFHWSCGWSFSRRILLGVILLAWSFSLWNIAHPAWAAVGLAVICVSAGAGGRWWLAGLLLAASFWMHQQVGGLALLGMVLFAGIYRAPRVVFAASIAGLALPLLLAWIFLPGLLGGAMRQVEYFPGLPLRDLPRQVIGAPLVTFGLWVLSLYFFRSNTKLRTFSFLAVLAYVGVGWMREGRGYLLGCFFLLSLVSWVAAPLLAAVDAPEKRREFFRWWLPTAGFFLLFSGEFPPFLIFAPLTAFFLVGALSRLVQIYPWLPRWWVFAPAFALLAGGGVHQARLLFLQAYASRDAIGKLSYGEVRQVSDELATIKNFLLSAGAGKGAPLLVLPKAPYLYPLTGLINPTPFDEVTEKSLARFSHGPLLAEYVKSGGKFLVVQGNPPPFLSGEIQEKFTPALSLMRFTVWRRNEN